MDEPLRIYGYHGTYEDAAASILTNGFWSSKNETDWLGDGTYFWQDAPIRAWEWADKHYGPNAAVVRSLIRLEDCIDLFDIEWMEELKSIALIFLDKYSEYLPEQKNKAHRRDRLFFNFVVDTLNEQLGANIKGIRSVFIEGEPIIDQSAIYDLSHVQIAVRDNSIIEESWKLKRSS